MKLHINPEWLRQKIAEGPEEPDGCTYCGAIAGCCSNYPNCPGGQTMTTEVTILISGNKACEVSVQESGPGSVVRDPTVVKPGGFVKKLVHGEQTVLVKETGEFL